MSLTESLALLDEVATYRPSVATPWPPRQIDIHPGRGTYRQCVMVVPYLFPPGPRVGRSAGLVGTRKVTLDTVRRTLSDCQLTG